MVAGDVDGTLEIAVAVAVASAPLTVAAEVSGLAVSRATGSTEDEVGVAARRIALCDWDCAVVVRCAADRFLLASGNPLG